MRYNRADFISPFNGLSNSTIYMSIFNVAVIHRLVSESWTRIGIITTYVCYLLIICQIYDRSLEYRVVISFLCGRALVDPYPLSLIARFRVK
jgi:hypothetical protein